ncbi:acyl-CoA/acyl-ACP dehydrogenase [Shinella sp. CPCC 101442]|uniref:acyl-CoA dehydrogenase family protein n=1 Tax=Shinella sp. CPCC 101442 TaxID=2932265 RepID=UPI0021525163|nr:acyl-CoA dehydrogenase family protein [Shinella sp. CPCC 101442]MCR6502360.1 acyl-CoA/acyl-ACP dehydrogenase [Shinella sp. CPCC 101442]
MTRPQPVSLATPVRAPQRARLPDVVRALAALAPNQDAAATFPQAGIRQLHDAGFLTASVVREYGGADYGVEQLARLLIEIGKGDPSVALIALMNLQFHAAQRPGDPRAIGVHLYRKILAGSERAPTLVNAFRAEPDLGSPARGGLPKTVARYSAEGWVLSGRKMFCTGSTGLSYHLPWAVTDEAQSRVAEFLVPADSEGIEIVPVWNHLGMRATESHDVIYQDVVVPHDHIAGAEIVTPDTRQDMRAVAPTVLLIQSIYIGVARAAQAAFHRYAHQRVPTALGKPIATTERIRSVAGEIELNIVQAEALLAHFASGLAAGREEAFRDIAAAKSAISAAVIRSVEIAVKALGNPGLSRANPLERHLRDVLCARIHSPQDDSVLLALGTTSLSRQYHPDIEEQVK